MMKIGFDAKRAFNNRTGLGNYSRFVIRGLARYFPENEYYLFTPCVEKEFEGFAGASPNIHMVTPQGALGKLMPSVWRTMHVGELCAQLKLDVFHGLSNELPAGMEKFNGRKLVTIHDLIFLRYPSYYKLVDRVIYSRKFAHACRTADVILATSSQTKDDIRHYYRTNEARIKVIGQNCDEVFSAPPRAAFNELQKRYGLPDKYILCVGTIEQRKNQLTVLKAFDELNEQRVHLVMIGRKTAYAAELEAYINRNDLRRRVHIVQDIRHEHLPVIYKHAAFLVYASEFEGFGIPLLEGFRSEIPVLAANTSSLPEVGGDAALYFTHDDFHELCAKMGVLLHDIPERERMIREGTKQAAKFDTPWLMRQLIDAYR